MNSKHEMYGLLYIGIGVVIFMAAAGPFLLNIIGLVLSLFLINYGMKLRNMPPLLMMLQEWFDDISRRLFRK